MRQFIVGFFLVVGVPSLFGQAAEAIGREALEAYVSTLEGERHEAGRFLLEHLPPADATHLPVALFRENLEQAFVARETHPWTKALDQPIFFNDVLPHAIVDETRDPWRLRLRELFVPLLGDAATIHDASKVVSANIAHLTGVKYSTEREKACQSPAESMRQGLASCTGLSILMVDALRAVGVPARLIAIPMWGTLEGNHTWVEIHDDGGWHMTGYGSGPDSWDKSWEIDRCAYCDPEQPIHGVFATSYRPTGLDFPTIWTWRGRPSGKLAEQAIQERDSDRKLIKLSWKSQAGETPGIDRTPHYIQLAGGRKIPIPKGSASIAVRAFIANTDERVDISLRVIRGEQIIWEGRTASAAQDLNDYARILCPPGPLRVDYQVSAKDWKSLPAEAVADQETALRIDLTPAEANGFFTVAQRRELADWFRNPDQKWPGTAVWPTLADAAATDSARAELWSIFRETAPLTAAAKELGPLPPTLAELVATVENGRPNLSPSSLTLGDKSMPFVVLRKETNPPPPTGRSLYICLHGGGANPDAPGPHSWNINTREWQAQMSFAAQLYAGEGVFFVPRMADDRLGRWWHGHVQDAVEAVVRHGIATWGVDPDRVYLLGISEGAYGTQILGPFMADRFGGANAMAGGVGDDVPAENLRNLAFRTDVGENDSMFDRVGLARKFHARMDAFRETSGGYENVVNVQPGKGHGIDYQPGPEWMIQHHRDPRPKTVVWTSQQLDDRRRTDFYWLNLSGKDLTGDIQMTARIDGNDIAITAVRPPDATPLSGARIGVMLDDRLVDLNRPVRITCNGKVVSEAAVPRDLETLARTLVRRGDPKLALPARLDIEL
jgi:hypothetical protein